jgi:hypothetical protein
VPVGERKYLAAAETVPKKTVIALPLFYSLRLWVYRPNGLDRARDLYPVAAPRFIKQVRRDPADNKKRDDQIADQAKILAERGDEPPDRALKSKPVTDQLRRLNAATAMAATMEANVMVML